MPPKLLALLAVGFWSTNAFAAKYAFVDLTVIQVLTVQFATAFLVLSLLRAFQHGTVSLFVGWPPIRFIFVGMVGLTGTIFLQYLAFDLGHIMEANVIAYAWPLFVAVWAAAVLRNAQGWTGLALASVGFAGVAVIFNARSGLDFTVDGTLGYAIAVASAFCMAFYTVASSRIRVSGDRLLIPATGLGAIIAFGLSLHGGVGWPNPSNWLIAAYIGTGPMAAGFALWTKAMAGEGVKRLAPIGYATPLASTALLLVSGESFTMQTLTGALMVLACSIGVLAIKPKAEEQKTA